MKDYQEQFEVYYDEIKQFCERNKKIALEKLSVETTLTPLVPEDSNAVVCEKAVSHHVEKPILSPSAESFKWLCMRGNIYLQTIYSG